MVEPRPLVAAPIRGSDSRLRLDPGASGWAHRVNELHHTVNDLDLATGRHTAAPPERGAELPSGHVLL
jgi:hypothetical protein